VTHASGKRRGVIRRRCAILAAGLLMGAVSGLTMTAVSNAGTASGAHAAAHAVGTAGGIVPCPAGSPSKDTCAAMPCPTASDCGQIVASPTQNLGLGQYVYLQLSGFGPGDTALVDFCSDPNNAPVAPQNLSNPPPPPICATSTPQYTAPPFGIAIFNTNTGSTRAGTATTSVETEEASPPGIALQGNQANSSFYCDTTAANACDIVVSDFTITASQGDFNIDAANSVEIPLTFAPAATCPGAAKVTTESEYGIEVLTPTLAQLSCSQNSPSKAAIPIETAVGGAQAIKDLAAGNVPIAFTDDPEAADQQASLKSGHFALIPVALTANIVGIDAEILGTGLSGTKQGILYPTNQMNLTPTMVAGEITNQGSYAASYTADDQVPCSGPSEDPGTQQCGSWPCGVLGNTTCSLFDQLNYLPGYGNYFQSSASMLAGTSGSTHQLFTWLCNAPLVPLNFGTNPTESQSGSQSLETGFSGLSGPKSACPAGEDQPPAFNAPPSFFTYNNPETQNIKAPLWIVNQGTRDAAAFINQNWAEGEYYGVGGVAGLQNGAGKFVVPTATSLDAAVQVATKNADGSLTPNYTSTNSDAYPMPDVIYAAVSTDPVSASQATAESKLLTQMLALTGTGGSNVGQLPAGFVPMPASLVTQAQTDIAKDIVTPSTPPGRGGGGGGGGGRSGTGGSGSTNALGSGVLGSSGLLGGAFSSPLPFFSGISPLAGTLANSPAKTAAASGHHGPTGPLLGPALSAYALVANQGSTVVALASILGLIALMSGLVLMSSAMLTKIRAARAAAPVIEDGGGSAEAPAAGASPP
jgi:hypothetical protein